MNTDDYISKANDLLSDTTTYVKESIDSCSKQVRLINNTLTKLVKAKELTPLEARPMRPNDSMTAQFYGLPKIHKDGVPLRPIVSLPGAPTYNLARGLARRIRHLTLGSSYSITNSNEALTRLRNMVILDDEIMVSFDVTSLYTSIDLDLAQLTVSKLLDDRPPDDQQLSRQSILSLLKLCLTTHFTFNGQLYQQKRGTPMGSPISGIIAETVMQQLENTVLPDIQPKIWMRYVDDSFVIIKRSQVEDTLRKLNHTIPGISFTMETECNHELPFLDILITRTKTGALETSVYRKATNTDQVLNYGSNHPSTHKRSCVRTLFARIESHCSTTKNKKLEMEHLHRTFHDNGYPRLFVKRALRNRAPDTEEDDAIPYRLALLPYIKDVSEMSARVLKQLHIKVAHKPTSSIRMAISNHKAPIPPTKRSNVVYKLPCQNCPNFYVGQTGRQLATRVHEHQLAIRRHDQLSLVSMHQDETGHQIDLDAAEILSYGRNRHVREFIEAWHSTNGAFNKHIDLDACYQPLRNKSLRMLNDNSHVLSPQVSTR